MELSPEERRRIYEEEKARLESKGVQASSTKPIQTKTVLLIILTIFGLSLLVRYYREEMIFRSASAPTSTPNSQPNSTSNTPIDSPVLRGIFGSNNSAPRASNSPAPSATPMYDPIDDTSEEGIRQNIQAVDKTITYEHLKKNAEQYDGEPWALTGRVFQIQESSGQTFALVSLDLYGNKLMAVKAKFTTEFVEKNQVYVVGYLSGNYSYKSVAGWDITIPAIDARAILKPSEAARIKVGKGTSKQ